MYVRGWPKPHLCNQILTGEHMLDHEVHRTGALLILLGQQLRTYSCLFPPVGPPGPERPRPVCRNMVILMAGLRDGFMSLRYTTFLPSAGHTKPVKAQSRPCTGRQQLEKTFKPIAKESH